MATPRMRTIKQIVNEMKQLDPHTSLSESSIRRLVKDGKLQSVQIGKKNLINLDHCLSFFNNPIQEIDQNKKSPEEAPQEIGKDRIDQFKSNIGMIHHH